MSEEFGWMPGSPVTAEDENPAYLQDRHHPLLGRHLPFNRIPEYPDIEIVPGYRLDCVLPTHFRGYTRFQGSVVADVAPTHDQVRHVLRVRLEGE